MMGQAKTRKAQQQAWYAALSGKERIVADASLHIHKRLARNAGYVGACYFYALFMRKFLKNEKGVEVTPIMGWAAYGGNLFGHAWIDVDGKRVDLSLTQSSQPSIAPPGELIILDCIVQSGASYNYYPETTDEISSVVGPERIAFSERMRTTATEDSLIDDYFNNAPSQYRYDAALTLLR